jgi:hypothetical protein
MEITGVTVATVITALGGVGGVVASLNNAYIRLGVLEALFKEKKETISNVKSTQEAMDKRLIEIETIVASLNSVLPDLRRFGEIANKLEILMSECNRSVERLEKVVYETQQK